MNTDQAPSLNLPPMNNLKKVMIEQLVRQQEFLDKVIVSEGIKDLFIFNRYVLEVEKDKQELAPFHKELCRFVNNDRARKKLILIPRGHLKSTLVTIGYSVFRIIQNPNIRILIRNATWQMAVDFLSEIKKHLTQNENLIRLFGNVAENPVEWSQDRITLNRTETNIKGPTVWATGIESNLVGAHPDLIIDDDLVNRDNIATMEQMNKIIMRYKDTLDLLEPGGQYIAIGTRWNEGDLYSWILEKENNIRSSYDVMIKKAYEGNLETSEGFVPLWPEKFTQKELQTRLREKGWYEFSSQYLNNCVPDEAADFKKRWFRHYDIEDIRGKELNKVMTVDPAISVDKDADYTAIVVSGIDQFGNIFILDLDKGHWNPNQIIRRIFDLSELWKPRQVGIETVAYQKALAYSIREKMNEEHRYLPIVEVKPENQSKDQRIRGLQPMYENGKVYHRRGLPWLPWFEDELLKFPRGKKDDFADSFSYAKDLLIPPKRPTVNRYSQQYAYVT